MLSLHDENINESSSKLNVAFYFHFRMWASSPYLCEDGLLVSSQEVRPLEDIWEETATQWHPAQLPWDKEGDAEESQTTGGHQQGQQAHRYI